MFNLPRPTIAADEIYDAASERFLDQSLRTKLAAARPTYLSYADDYVAKGTSWSLHQFDPSNPASHQITDQELVALYDQGLLRRRSKARLLYEEIRLSTEHNICPYCNHRTVGQLDHFLAKSKFPLFSVCPSNLVPSCADCNKAKSSRNYNSFESAPLHPYFDFFEGVEWLKCVPERLEDAWIGRFEIDGANLELSNVEKLRSHFSEFGLWELYTIQSSAELARQAGLITSFRETGGVEAVTDYLARSLKSFKSLSNNHWRTALARGCLNSEDYLIG